MAGSAGDVGSLLDAARTQLSGGDAAGVFKTLERAREAAMKRKSLDELRAVQAVAQEASARFGASGRRAAKASGDLLYAVKQNIAFQERVAASRGGGSAPAPSGPAMPMPAATAAAPPASPPRSAKSGWGKSFGIFGGGVGALIVVIIIVAVAGGHKSKPTSASAPTGALTTTAAAAPVDTNEQHARDWISQHGFDANRVYANIADVQLAVGLFQKSATEANLNQLAQTAQAAHDNIDAIRADFAGGYGSDTLGNAELEAFSGANDLKNAMGALVAYTGTPNPATLAHFTSQYGAATAEWNDGVRTIWRIAHRLKPPTV